MTRVGRRPESAADFLLLDLADPVALSHACAEADVVINTAHDPELAAERTVLREGGVLIDLIELSQPERALLRSQAAEAPRGLVVSDTGLGGVAYLVIADLLRTHPEADAADYSLMVSAAGSGGRAGALFAHSLLTDASHHRSVKLPFPRPFGVRRCLQVGADRDGMLRDGVLRAVVGETPVRHYLCMLPRPLQGLLLALNGAHLMSMLPSASFTAGTGKVPAKPSDERICEWVGVSRDGRRLGARTLEGRGYYDMTAAATLAFADALLASTAAARGRRGLLSIDEVLTLDAVRPALERHEILIVEQPVEDTGRTA